MINAENIGYKATGGLFHRFFIFVYSINAVGLIVLTVLTAFGVLQGDPAPWTPETNFASWYMVGGLIIAASVSYTHLLGGELQVSDKNIAGIKIAEK